MFEFVLFNFDAAIEDLCFLNILENFLIIYYLRLVCLF